MAKVLSKDLYRVLRTSLAPWFKGEQFKRLPHVQLGWFREELPRPVSVWFQCDKYGWFDCFGSSFTLEFESAETPGAFQLTSKRERLGQLISAAAREEIRTKNNIVARFLPAVPSDHPVNSLSPTFRESFLSAYGEEHEPYAANRDIWLRYFTQDDVEFWAKFLLQNMPAMLEAFRIDGELDRS